MVRAGHDQDHDKIHQRSRKSYRNRGRSKILRLVTTKSNLSSEKYPTSPRPTTSGALLLRLVDLLGTKLQDPPGAMKGTPASPALSPRGLRPQQGLGFRAQTSASGNAWGIRRANFSMSGLGVQTAFSWNGGPHKQVLWQKGSPGPPRRDSRSKKPSATSANGVWDLGFRV